MNTYLSAYFSHSWSHRDLPINLMLWERMAANCHLLIDKPEATTESERPYFISRIESVLRRADLFVGCVPMLPPQKQATRPPDAIGDWRYHLCSPYILFELRLAERVDLPRFVLYDRASRFQPPPQMPSHVRYVGRSFEELQALIAGGGQDGQLLDEFDQWLSWVAKNRVPQTGANCSRAAYLLADDGPGKALQSVVAEAVDEGGFERPEPLNALFHTDAELYQALRSLGLLVVDVSRTELWPLYHAAHSLMVPTVRVHSEYPATEPGTDDFLPSLLRGHPAGYQLDLLAGHPSEPFFTRLHDRAKAVTRSTQPVIGFEKGRTLLYERTYPRKHFVFISHDEKLNGRALVDAIVAECWKQGITCWEYAVENRSGDAWRQNMNDALTKTTHMIALLSPDYEKSPGCKQEWDHAIDSKEMVTLLPFLTGGRTQPSVDLRGKEITHEPLTAVHSPQENAARVVERLRASLLNPKPV